MFILILIIIKSISGHESCDFHMPRLGELITNGNINVNENSLEDNPKLTEFTNNMLRIKYHFTDEFNQFIGSSSIKTDVLEPARLQLQNILGVKYPVTGNLISERSCLNGQYRMANGIRGCSEDCVNTQTCLNVNVPDMYLKKCTVINSKGEFIYSGSDGVGSPDTDIVLIVSYLTCAGNVLAYANSCLLGPYDRPILGVVNICPGVFVEGKKTLESINVIKHEIIHALGFSVDKYAYYRHQNNDPIVSRNTFGFPTLGIFNNQYYVWNDQIIRKFNRSRESISMNYTKTFNAFVLPNVLSVARDHFGCQTLDGVDLEDFGGAGSELSHFDEYAYNSELMSPQTDNGLDKLSKLTLALLLDTGWYLVDYTKADIYQFANNSGCTLPLMGCYKYMNEKLALGQSIAPFCNRLISVGDIYSCSNQNDYYQYCFLNKYTADAASQYQYFKSLPYVASNEVNKYYGDSEYGEFCPVYAVLVNPNSICSDATNNNLAVNNIITPYYGSDSICIDNKASNSQPFGYYGASCSKYALTGTNSMKFYVGTSEFSCPSSKTLSTFINGYEITFQCPSKFNGGSIKSIQYLVVTMSIGISLLFVL